MSWATRLASRPRGTSSASTRCQSWLMSAGLAVNVFMYSATLGFGLGQIETDSQDSRPWLARSILESSLSGGGPTGVPPFLAAPLCLGHPQAIEGSEREVVVAGHRST